MECLLYEVSIRASEYWSLHPCHSACAGDAAIWCKRLPSCGAGPVSAAAFAWPCPATARPAAEAAPSTCAGGSAAGSAGTHPSTRTASADAATGAKPSLSSSDPVVLCEPGRSVVESGRPKRSPLLCQGLHLGRLAKVWEVPHVNKAPQGDVAVPAQAPHGRPYQPPMPTPRPAPPAAQLQPPSNVQRIIPPAQHDARVAEMAQEWKAAMQAQPKVRCQSCPSKWAP